VARSFPAGCRRRRPPRTLARARGTRKHQPSVSSSGAQSGRRSPGGRRAAVTSVSPVRHVRRDLRAITADGIAYSVTVGAGESYLPAFVLAAGLGDVASGLVATLPMLVGACFQLLTPAGVAALGSYRRWVVGCATLQALSLAPLAVAAAVGRVPLGLAFGCAAAYWGFGLATSPAWNTWVGTLVPRRVRARFFAGRNRTAQAALFIAFLSAGLLLEAGSERGGPPTAFAALFGAALLARVVSSRFLAAQSEPTPPHESLRLPPPARFLGRLGRGRDGRLLAHLLVMQLAVNVAAPFFTPYMLSERAFSYATFTTFTAAAFAGRVLALPLVGKLAERRGAGVVLALGAGGIVPLPSLWLVSNSWLYLFTLQLFAGACWAAFELATLVAILEHLPERERTGVLAWYNLSNALVVAAGSLLGSAIFTRLGGGQAAYTAIFLVSSAGRVLALPMLRRVRAAELSVEAAPLRTLAVRPSAGAVQRPILAGLPPLAEDEDGDGAARRDAR
jgi:MFS family permease